MAGYETVVFRTEGLHRLLDGLRTSGIGAQHFPWPPAADPDRSPYRGWQPFDAVDAAVYFGRDAQIVRGMDLLRGMRTAGKPSVFAILGPSGTGKSSFMRAGLLPRLARDDREFVVLDIVRPERAALTGAHGLAVAIHGTRARLGLGGRALGDLKTALPHDVELVRDCLREIARAAHTRLLDTGEALPTLVLPIDQAEELFGADAGVEGDQLLHLLAQLLADPAAPLIIVLTIRTDRYELFQTASPVAEVETLVFDHLKPLPRTRFRELITGPAARATAAGRRLTIEPALLDELVADCTDGADTLPLLALTLSRLHHDYGEDGVLRLDEYTAMGEMARVVRTEIDALLAADPDQRREQLGILRSAFIPWLATVNPENDYPLRRIARWNDLPAESHALIDRFVDARLMVKDHRDGETVVEVAVESLLRQWDELAAWLREEADALKDADALEQSALSWEHNGCDDAWLVEGTRLVEAETLSTKPGFRERLESVRPYLVASRARENERADVEKRRQREELRAAKEQQETAEALAAASAQAEWEAQQYANGIRQRSRLLLVLATLSVVIMLVAAGAFVVARKNKDAADERARDAVALQLVAQSKAILSGNQDGGDALAFQLVLAALKLSEQEQVRAAAVDILYENRGLQWVTSVNSLSSVSFDTDGSRVSFADSSGILKTLDTATGEFREAPAAQLQDSISTLSPDATRAAVVRNLDRESEIQVVDPISGRLVTALAVDGAVIKVAFSSDGSRLVATYGGDTVQVWDARSGVTVGGPWPSDFQETTYNLAISSDGRRVAWGQTHLQVWDVDAGRRFDGLFGARAQSEDSTAHIAWSLAFSSDGHKIVVGSIDGGVEVWDIETAQLAAAPVYSGLGSMVTAVALSPDGRRFVAGDSSGALQVWDLERMVRLGAAIMPATEPMAVHFTPDSEDVVVVGSNGTVRRLDPEAGTLPRPFSQLSTSYRNSGLSSDGSRMITCYDGDELQVWDVRAGRKVGSLPDREACTPQRGSAFRWDGRKFMFVTAAGNVRVWDVDSGQTVSGQLPFPLDDYADLAFGAEGDPILMSIIGPTAQIWNPMTGDPVTAPMRASSDELLGPVFSADGRWVALQSVDNSVVVWDTKTGQAEGRPMKLESQANLLKFSPDGTKMVSNNQGTVSVWDISSGRTVADITTGHLSVIALLTFSQDGRYIASADARGALRIWHADSGAYVGGSTTTGTSVDALEYTPGVGFIALYDRAIRTWPLYDDVEAPLCDKLRSNMREKDWETWVGTGEPVKLCDGLP
ncbi:NACHT and WD repeat domain-containing protein [Nocardia sp. NPDC050712]|uniref:NACHT and WD repeat domain-containing protein n=1 Tax=Nocardia sp. NPDC050712 TaxID=3155518 RepID=UPI0033EEB2BB